MKSIQEIRDSLTKISKWPWRFDMEGYNGKLVSDNSGYPICQDFYENGPQDGPFIASAPQLISELCDRLEVAKKALEFYADIETLTLDGKPFLVDKGKIAREALEAIK